MSWVGQRVAGEEDVDEVRPRPCATIAGAAPVCTTPGPPTHSTFLPCALASRMPSATWRTSTACGFSEDTSDSMKPNESPPLSIDRGCTRMPEAPVTTHVPA